MLKYIINSSICLFIFFGAFAQENPKKTESKIKSASKEIIKEVKSEISKDSISYKTAYGFRLGGDISKLIISTFDETYNGFELVGDYRINSTWYIAAEVGYEEKTTIEDYTNSTSQGSYIKLGVNKNFYDNWLDMNNEIYVGGRYGFALFQQTLNEYTPNVNDANFPEYFSSTSVTPDTTQSGLQAHWVELQVGAKVETFKNLFLGVSTAFKIALSIKDQTDFATLYAPGFNRVYSSKTGFGFNYTISYLIPFKKK